MIKKLTPPLLILMGLLFSVISAKAATYTNKAVSVVFPMSDKDNPGAYTVSLKDAFSTVTFDMGNTKNQGLKNISDTKGNTVVSGIALQPNSTGVNEKINWFVAPSEGLTFTPTKVSGYVNRDGTDVEKGITISVKKKNGEEITLGTYTAWRSGKNSSTKAYDQTAIYQYEITLTEDQQTKLKGTDGFYLISTVGVTNNTKKGIFANITIEGTVDGTTSSVAKYTKPAITQGAYDRATATYAVTLATQNDEVGTINYTIGSNEQVTGAASGTVVNVPINTTVKATVSGTTFDTSDEAAFTTSDMPTLATPTQTIQAYDFEKQLYTVALSAAEGATIKYTVDGGAETDYTAPFAVALNKEVTAYAVLENMKNSATLTFSTAGAPKDGTHTTPQDYNYTDGMVYDAGAYSITNNPNYIGAKISSGNSSINGAIKMRIGRQADPKDFADKYGFHLDVNKGYIITSVKLQLLNNYNTDIALTGIYVDDATTNNLLATPLTIPYASGKDVKAVTAEAKNITASDRIVFTFDKNSGTDNPNQGQVLITVTYKVPEFITVNSTAGYGTMYYEKELKVPADTKAYTAALNGNTLTLNELTDGIIPAKTAVLVSGNGGLFEFSTTGATFTGKNDLKGTATDIATSSVEGGTVCTLGYIDGQTGFYKYTGETLNANKAYLVVPEAAMASAKGINIVIGNPTGVAEVKTAENVADAPIYNIAGQKVTKNAKGIVIINGKAYINK